MYPGLKSVILIKNMAIFRIKKPIYKLSRYTALLICVSYYDGKWNLKYKVLYTLIKNTLAHLPILQKS